MRYFVYPLLFLGVACQDVQSSSTCDRDCLESHMDQVITAMIAGDASPEIDGEAVRYTENGQALEVGRGLWQTASGRGNYSLVFADVDSRQAGFMGLLKEHGDDVLVSMRVRVDDDRVTEVESIVSRDPGRDAGEAVKILGSPNPLWSTTVPADERMSRAALIEVANAYFTGMENNDGQGWYPFSEDCNRLENGHQTTNNPDIQYGNSEETNSFGVQGMGCKEQFETGFFAAVTRIRDRRYPIVDVERGIVYAFAFFDHNGTVDKAELTDGRSVNFSLRRPFTWEVGEAFKIENGEIRFIEAVAKEAPYGMPSGWEEQQ